jgi:hypothetical protein
LKGTATQTFTSFPFWTGGGGGIGQILMCTSTPATPNQ